MYERGTNVERKIEVSQYRRKELNSKQVVQVDKCKSPNQSYYLLYLYNIYWTKISLWLELRERQLNLVNIYLTFQILISVTLF